MKTVGLNTSQSPQQFSRPTGLSYSESVSHKHNNEDWMDHTTL